MVGKLNYPQYQYAESSGERLVPRAQNSLPLCVPRIYPVTSALEVLDCMIQTLLDFNHVQRSSQGESVHSRQKQ